MITLLSPLITILLALSGGAAARLVRNSEAVTTGLFLYVSPGLALMRSVPARRPLLSESSRCFLCWSLISARVVLLSGSNRSLSVWMLPERGESAGSFSALSVAVERGAVFISREPR
jgi:hypothetical protein